MSTIKTNLKNISVASDLKISVEELDQNFSYDFISVRWHCLQIHDFIFAQKMSYQSKIVEHQNNILGRIPIMPLNFKAVANEKELKSTMYSVYYQLIHGLISPIVANIMVKEATRILQSFNSKYGIYLDTNKPKFAFIRVTQAQIDELFQIR